MPRQDRAFVSVGRILTGGLNTVYAVRTARELRTAIAVSGWPSQQIDTPTAVRTARELHTFSLKILATDERTDTRTESNFVRVRWRN